MAAEIEARCQQVKFRRSPPSTEEFRAPGSITFRQSGEKPFFETAREKLAEYFIPLLVLRIEPEVDYQVRVCGQNLALEQIAKASSPTKMPSDKEIVPVDHLPANLGFRAAKSAFGDLMLP